MDFSFTAGQLATQRAAREFTEREIKPYVRDYDREERFPIEIARRMGALGMLGGVIPEEYGGAGLDYVSFVLLIEEVSRSCQVLGQTASAPSGLVGAGILRYGTEELKRQYLTPLARGQTFAGSGLTEPHSGTDVAAMETTLTREGDHYILHGAKTWISHLEDGDWFLTLGQMDRSKGYRGVTAVVVEKSWSGVTTRPFHNKVGFRPLPSGELIFDHGRVPLGHRVGEEGQGFAVAMSAVEGGRLGVAARALGMIQSCLEQSVEYAQGRIVFDQPIGRYQLVQSKITDMAVGLEAARWLAYHVAWLKDQGASRLQRDSSIAKLYATDVLMQAAIDACQIHGAYSCSDEYAVGRYFRDA
ncbi:MAG: acyl-CoA dehydrogenase family protein, partial [Chloroflexi bacterium]|nr:acyl-CoA dehydrogenase family protein [Chloroflexota bacterium]